MAWQLVRHAFTIVFGNLEQAIRASAVPFLIMVVITVVLGFGASASFDPMDDDILTAGDVGAGALTGLAMSIASLLLFGWVAVTWHRFILKEEYPGIIPAISGRPIASYIGKSILIGLLIILALIPIMLIVLPVLTSLLSFNVVVVTIWSFVLGLVASYLWLRLAIILPGVAVGESMNLMAGWGITKPLNGTILGVAAIIGVINGIMTLIAMSFADVPVLGFLVNVAVQWLTVMVGVSILTTLYGHLVEGRDLPT